MMHNVGTQCAPACEISVVCPPVYHKQLFTRALACLPAPKSSSTEFLSACRKDSLAASRTRSGRSPALGTYTLYNTKLPWSVTTTLLTVGTWAASSKRWDCWLEGGR